MLCFQIYLLVGCFQVNKVFSFSPFKKKKSLPGFYFLFFYFFKYIESDLSHHLKFAIVSTLHWAQKLIGCLLSLVLSDHFNLGLAKIVLLVNLKNKMLSECICQRIRFHNGFLFLALQETRTETRMQAITVPLIS